MERDGESDVALALASCICLGDRRLWERNPFFAYAYVVQCTFIGIANVNLSNGHKSIR